MKKFFGIIFLLTFQICFAQQAHWTSLISIESFGDLSYWAVKNVNDMMLAKPSDNANILIQWHPGENIAWRHQIKNKQLIQKESVEVGKDIAKDISNASEWAFKSYPAKYNCLILWNHGFGILDPKYTPGLDGLEWDVEPDEANTKITRSIDFPTLCPFNHKGTFFNGESKIYLTNEKMVETLTTITKDSLNGKKIDILGADCCKMAMIEVCYQVKDFVNYFIGSQNCELKDGWDYKAIFNGFKDSEQTPLQASKMIVDTYDTYYKNHAEQGMYTLSALDLSITDELTKNVDRIATLLKKFMENDSQKFKKNITNARSRCVKICYSPYYTDLDSVYTQMLNEFENQDTSMFPKKDFTELKKLLTDGKEIIKKMVVANSTGSNKKDAKGISIYFPRHKIDESYLDTLFAKETSWLSFLQKFISE